MKIDELINVPSTNQIKSPQSPGSRGLRINKTRPQKRYFDSKFNKNNQLKKQ